LTAVLNRLCDLGAELVCLNLGDALCITEGDLILVAVDNPRFDGLSVAKAVRTAPNGQSYPILFVSTAFVPESALYAAYEAGVTDYLVPPYEPSMLRYKIRALLNLGKRRIEPLSLCEDVGVVDDHQIYLQEAERRVAHLMEDKVLLLREVHHRVRNNLQTIMSLLTLQRYASDCEWQREQLRLTENRVFAMASVHELLSLSRSSQTVPLDAHLAALASFSRSSSVNASSFSFSISVDPSLELPLDVAVPIALLVQELISESIRCAKAEEGLVITIEARRVDGDRCALCIGDNGKQPIEPYAGGRIGPMLVGGMVEQVQGTCRCLRKEERRVCVEFPLQGAGRPVGPFGQRTLL